MLLRRIEYIDQEIAATKRQIERHGATEIDLEIIRLQAEARMNYTKCLAVMMEQPQAPLPRCTTGNAGDTGFQSSPVGTGRPEKTALALDVTEARAV
jgi:hypothetical protein